MANRDPENPNMIEAGHLFCVRCFRRLVRFAYDQLEADREATPDFISRFPCRYLLGPRRRSCWWCALVGHTCELVGKVSNGIGELS